MGLSELIKYGFFKNFTDFSNIGRLLLVWVFLIGGFLIQNLINQRVKKLEKQWLFLAALLIVIIVLQIVSNTFKKGEPNLTVLFIFGLAICAAVGAAISGVIWYINMKRGKTPDKE